MEASGAIILIYGADTQNLTFKKFQLKSLIESSQEVICIDASQIFYKDKFVSHAKQNPSNLDITHFEVTSFSELRLLIKKLNSKSNTHVFFDLPYRIRVFLEFSILRYQFPKLVFCILAISNNTGDRVFLWNSLKNIKKNFRRLIKSCIMAFTKTIIRKANIVFYAGSSNKNNIYIGQRTLMTPVIHPDLIPPEVIPSKKQTDKFILYLDSGFYSTLDNLLFDIRSSNTQEYEEKLFSFLKNIERRFSMNVLIAAHPKSTYFLNHSGFVDGIRYIKNDTFNLCQQAEAICTDYPSNSLSMPIYLNKPIFYFFFHSIFNRFKNDDWRYRVILDHESMFNKEFLDPLKDNNYEIICNQINSFYGYEDYLSKFIISDKNIKSPDFASQFLKNLNSG